MNSGIMQFTWQLAVGGLIIAFALPISALVLFFVHWWTNIRPAWRVRKEQRQKADYELLLSKVVTDQDFRRTPFPYEEPTSRLEKLAKWFRKTWDWLSQL